MIAYISKPAPTEVSPKAIIRIEINNTNEKRVCGVIPYKDGIVNFEADGYLNVDYQQKMLEVTALSLTEFTYKTMVNGVWIPSPSTDDMAISSAILTVLADHKADLFESFKSFDLAFYNHFIESEITNNGTAGVILLSVDQDKQDELVDNHSNTDYYELSFTSSYEVFFADEHKQKLVFDDFVLTLGDYDLFTYDENGDHQSVYAEHLPAALLHDMTCRATRAVKDTLHALTETIIEVSGGSIEVMPATAITTKSGAAAAEPLTTA